MNKSFITLLFLSTLTGGIFVALTAKIFPLFAAKTVYFCQQFLSNTLFQIPRVFPNTLILALVLMLFIGVLSFLIQQYRTWGLWKRFARHAVALPKRVQKTIVILNLKNRVYVVRDSNLFSFCVGLISPRVVITTGLIDSLSDRELEAVLLHEQAHIQNYDPLKMVFGKTIASMFFFLPIFAELNKNMITVNELLADNWTIQRQQTSAFIKGAMKKILVAPQMNIAEVPAISNPDTLEVRIYRLVNLNIKHTFYLSWASIVTTILFLALGLFLLQTPVDAFQLEHSQEASYFLCSGNTMCRQQCRHNAQMSPVASPENLFSSYTPKYEAPGDTH